MAQQIFQIAVDTDDIYVFRNSATTEYPPVGGYSRVTNDADMVSRKLSGGVYTVLVNLLRWDTSSIPVGATLDSVYLRMKRNMGAYNNVDGLVQTGEWFLFTGTDATDWTHTPGTNAFASFDPTGGSAIDYDIALSNVNNISRTGYTGIRMHASQRAADAAPSGLNEWYWQDFFNHGAANAPRLVLNYTPYPGSGPGEAYIQLGP